VNLESNGEKTVEIVPDYKYRVVNGRKYGAGVKIVTGGTAPKEKEAKDADK
jgi:hypothetical protein